jgi:hypothetical protein
MERGEKRLSLWMLKKMRSFEERETSEGTERKQKNEAHEMV